MLNLTHPSQSAQEIVDFLRHTFRQQRKQKAVIAVSGGIDSAVSLSLLCQAIGPENVTALFLPFKNQSMVDAQTIVSWNKVPVENCLTYAIEPLVTAMQTIVTGLDSAPLRLGNVVARARMIIVYDTAKRLDALVCGTENKSEKYLGYFTRFGDEASDIEPLQHLYKTQLRQVAVALKLPEVFLTKAPSAGLWQDQSDEVEMGFGYELADKVLWQYIDEGKTATEIEVEGATPEQITRIIHQVDSMRFKQAVPYVLD